MGVSINKLNDLSIKSLTYGKHFDGGGLYLHIKAISPPSKLWRFKYRFYGMERLLSIGQYPQVSLKEARQSRDDAKRLMREGIDPSKAKVQLKRKQQTDSLNTFETCAVKWIEKMSAKWTPKTTATISSLFMRDAYPFIGKKPMTEVTTIELLHLVQRVESRGANFQAKRLLMRLGGLFRWAVVNQITSFNPTSNLRSTEVLKGYQVEHRRALAKEDLPSFLHGLETYSGEIIVSLGMSLLLHTAMRPGEVRNLRWIDVDFEKKMLFIPAERMKMRRNFRVPLSPQTISILQRLKSLTGIFEFVLASPVNHSKPISENTLNLAIRRLGYKATSHGFRSTFSTIANESQNFSSDAIEAALAHQDKNKIRSIYARSDYFEHRVRLMNWWSNFLDSRVQQKSLANIKAA